MRIKVHPGLCNGWGECHRWGREVYPLDEEGYCELRLLEVPPEMEDHARLGAVRATQPEVDDRRAAGRDGAPHRLARDGDLVRHRVEHGGLDELRLRQRRGHLEERLVGQDDPALVDRADVPREAEPAQRCEQLGRAAQQACQRVDVAVGDLEGGEPVDRLVDTVRDEEPTRRRQTSDEQAERRRGDHAPPQVRRDHRHLVQVGDEERPDPLPDAAVHVIAPAQYRKTAATWSPSWAT